MLAFKLSGEKDLPDIEPKRMAIIPPPPESDASPATIKRGQDLYHTYCNTCHSALAISAGVISDLRYSSKAVHDNFKKIVLEGVLVNAGMASFSDLITEEEAEAIHAYIIHRAKQDRALQLEAAEN
jgi:quinohemoprotein ethanol dehydrogenase